MSKKEHLICSQCKTRMEMKKTTVDLEDENILIKFRDVPTEVCPSCGAEYLPASVAKDTNREMEQIKKAVQKALSIPKEVTHPP